MVSFEPETEIVGQQGWWEVRDQSAWLGFLEKVSKGLEVDKALAKDTLQASISQRTDYSKNARAKFLDYGKEDLHSFFG